MSTKLAGCLSLLAITTLATPAFSLDGYKDRRGIFAGVNVGGGAGFAGIDTAGELTGLDENRQLGLHLGAEVGGGISEKLTAALEANWWIRTVTLGPRRLDHQHLSFLPVARYFIWDGFNVGAGAGLAYAVFDTERNGVETFRYREMGLALKIGAGYEFFLNGTIAAGIDLGYTRHFYNNADFDTLGAQVTLRWY